MPINWGVDTWWYIHTMGHHSAVSCWRILSQETLERIRPDPEVTWGLVPLAYFRKGKAIWTENRSRIPWRWGRGMTTKDTGNAEDDGKILLT